MKLNHVLPGILALVAFGCSSAPKQGTEAQPTANAPAAQAPATQAAKPVAQSSVGPAMTCEQDKDKRTIEIAPKGNGCEVRYTKGGKTDVPATSANGNAHCEKTRDKIRGKLEAAGYRCS